MPWVKGQIQHRLFQHRGYQLLIIDDISKADQFLSNLEHLVD